MKNLYLLIFLSIVFNVNAQGPTFEWASQIGGSQTARPYSITSDANDNVYSVGTFNGTIDLDPGSSILNHTTNGYSDIYIQKLDSDGNLLWARQVGGGGAERLGSIVITDEGDILVTGGFGGTVDFDPGIGVSNYTSIGADIFILKLDENGNFIWVKQIGGNGYGKSSSIDLDSDGNLYLTGSIEGTFDFDPGIGTMNLTTLSTGYSDIFVLKLDMNGDFVWAKQMVGTGVDYLNATGDYAKGIIVDELGNVCLTGYFVQTTDFDPNLGTWILTSSTSTFYDIFVLKLDTNGNLIWVKQMGSSSWDYATCIATDESNNIYVGGVFSGTVDFDPNSGITEMTVPVGYKNAFIQKLDASGNLVWVKQIAGGGTEEVLSIAIDDDGNVYNSGVFSSSADFDPSSSTNILTSNGGGDAYIQKLDANGNLLWAEQFGGGGWDYAWAINISENGYIYCAGSFENVIDLDPSESITNLTANGSYDGYIQKLSQNTVGIIENSFEESIDVYPNPSIGDFFIAFENEQKNLSVRLFSLVGQLLEMKSYQNTNRIEMNIDHPNGIYLAEINNESGQKFVIRLVKE